MKTKPEDFSSGFVNNFQHLFKISCIFVHYMDINKRYIILAREKRQEVKGMLDSKEFDNNINPPDEGSVPNGYTGNTDRATGEYHYKNGFTQKIYSDAHYVPADENTVPPRYYTPPEKPVKEPAPPKKKNGGSALVRTICICLICAILGSAGGAAIAYRSLSPRIEQLEASVSELDGQGVPEVSASIGAAISNSTGLNPSEIYDVACSQVVGITTEVTYTNFFGMTSSSAVSGSGFIISEDGYVLTNYHVISYAYEGNSVATVIMHDGTRYEAEVVGVEPGNDIAVLKIEASGLKAVSFGDSDRLKVGDTVYPVGNPLGELEFSMSTGHVSALDRYITTDESGGSINMFQMDAAVNSGNSGGPVYNDKGQVVGVVTAKYASTGVEGLGFAIPINDAVSIADDLITKGYVSGKAYMGIQVDQRYNAMYSQFYELPLGAFVAGVEPGSCAEKAGIKKKDIIVSLGGELVESHTDLTKLIKQYRAGDTVELVVYRDGAEHTLSLVFDEYKPAT